MQTTTEIVSAARLLADELATGMAWHSSDGHGGYWKATTREQLSTITARAVGALEFLRRYAGPDSYWTSRAVALYDSKGDSQSTESGAKAVADVIHAWADQVASGLSELIGDAGRRTVDAVNTDVMTIVRRMIDDPGSHPAPPIVLCGAALEISLRALCEALDLRADPKATISGLTGVLRAADVLSKQDVKDLEMCGGLRNSAAHGEFATLSMERAGLMEQQTNLLLRRLEDLLP